MSNIVTIKGSLFSAPKGSIIIHACNTKGMWGSGIAKAFAKLYPLQYHEYTKACQEKGASLLGTCLLLPARSHIIGCLFTSKNYGQYVDSPDRILKATKTAIDDLIKQNVDKLPMHMCKINSGLFKVPWKDTKAILKETGESFTVYDF
jgi:ADP-ribose 1''-phosphate phosphatase